jgi:hypothetical protein
MKFFFHENCFIFGRPARKRQTSQDVEQLTPEHVEALFNFIYHVSCYGTANGESEA